MRARNERQECPTPPRTLTRPAGKIENRTVPCVRVTNGPRQHYYGYYDSRQFDASDRYLLGLECDVIGRLQKPGDRAVLGVVDLEHGNEWIPVAETAAWNWQMGCRAEWLPGTNKTIIYNVGG